MGLLGTPHEVDPNSPVENAPSEQEPKKSYWYPTGDRVLVRPAARQEVTKSGIYLPPQAQEKQFHGVVVGVGPGAHQFGFFVGTKVRVGQQVLYSKHAGHDLAVNGEAMIIIKEGDILAVMMEESEVPQEFLEDVGGTTGDSTEEG